MLIREIVISQMGTKVNFTSPGRFLIETVMIERINLSLSKTDLRTRNQIVQQVNRSLQISSLHRSDTPTVPLLA